MGLLQPGVPAPAFTLSSGPEKKHTLSEWRGHPLIIAFYPADWSPVCKDQLTLYNELLSEFKKWEAAIIGISVDSVWSHLAFAQNQGIRFPLLADYEPKGQVARAFGVYQSQEGCAERALFVLDKEGIVRWSYLSPVGVNPGADGILKALKNEDCH